MRPKEEVPAARTDRGQNERHDALESHDSAVVSSQPAQFTKITATNPKILTKSFHLTAKGELVKTPGGPLVEGTAERLTIAGIAELAAVIATLGPEHALVYGINGAVRARIVTQEKLPRAKQVFKSKVIARDRDGFKWPVSGIMTFDFDSFEATHAEDIFNLLVALNSGFESAPMAIFPSASSCLYHDETCLKGLTGWRALALVQDASDIPRAGDTLFKTAWLKNHGFIFISKSGAQLVRGPIDNSVWQPERLDFVAGAHCHGGVEQRRPAPVLYNKDAAPFDTSNIQTLTPGDLRAFEIMVSAAKDSTVAAAKEQRAVWMESQIENEIQKTPDATDADKAKIRERITRASTHRFLQADFELQTLDGKAITVETILQNREQWHLQYVRDPFDAGDRPRARLHTMTGGKPYLWSFSEAARYTLSTTRAQCAISPGARVDAVDGLMKTARESGGVFRRSEEIVSIDENADIKPLDTPALQFVLDGLVMFQRFDARTSAPKPADCPKNYAEGMGVSARLYGGLPTLTGVISHPTLDPATGRLIVQDGYDAATGLLLRLNATDWPPIPDQPTEAETSTAISSLLDPFLSFPFCGDVDRGVYLAAILTAVVRGLLPTAPLFLISAPSAGTGKTLLSLILARIVNVPFPSMFPFGGIDETEIRKRLLSIFRSGTRVVILDNLTGTLASESLCMALTNPTFSDRVLGVSNFITAPSNTLMVATGNNVAVAGDLCRRMVTARLDSGLENPWKRVFPETSWSGLTAPVCHW